MPLLRSDTYSSSFSWFDFRARRTPPPLASPPCALRVLGSAPYRVQIHIAPLLASTASRQSLPRPRYPYRFTCSRDECGVLAGLSGSAVWLCSLRLVFCLPFSAFGNMNRGLFFLYKVRSPTQLPSGSLKPATPIYTTILRKWYKPHF